MDLSGLYELRETYNRERNLLCFNGPFSQGLIEEIGNALRRYLKSAAAGEGGTVSSSLDVFAVYVEIAQNIEHYTTAQEYEEPDCSATVVIGRDVAGHYVISAGNIVEEEHGLQLVKRVESLAGLDKTQLKSLYREQLRRPSDVAARGAGLGLIDISRKARAPITCALHPNASGTRSFFSLRVCI